MRFGVRGRSPGQLQRPTGVTVDMNGDIIVADYDNRWISIFSSDGKFKVNSLSSRKREKKSFRQSNVWLISSNSSSGSQNKIGAGRLMGPKGVAVDKNGHIITADNKACCVFIFQSNGKLVTKFGARGTSDRHFAGTVSAQIQVCFLNDFSYRITSGRDSFTDWVIVYSRGVQTYQTDHLGPDTENIYVY